MASKRKVKRRIPKMTQRDKTDWNRIQAKIERSKSVTQVRTAIREAETALENAKLALQHFIAYG